MIKSAFTGLTKTTRKKLTSFSTVLVLSILGLGGATPLLTQTVAAAPAVSVCASGCDYLTIQEGIDNVDTGGTVNVGAGTYAGNNIIVNKPVSLMGAPGAVVAVPNVSGTNGFNVQANNVTINGFTITGPADSTSYLTYPWGGTVTRGIFVYTGYTNFAITNNVIKGLRNNILIDGRNTGAVTGNTIDNSKSGISVQYTDAGTGNTEGYSINISGNQESTFGNEWGVNMHLNGHDVGGTLVPNSVKIAANAPDAVQTALLANKAANGNWAVQDQGYSFQNRTEVAVATTGSDSNQGSKLGPLATVQAGADAVTKNGVVTVSAGTYTGNVNVPVSGMTLQAPSGATLNLGSGFGINLNNGPAITNFTMTGFTVNASPTTTYALKAYKADGLTLTNDTFNGSTPSNGGGVDINSTSNVTLTNVTANGFKKNGFAVTAQFAGGDTPSSNIAFNGITASNNGWAGIAFYTMNGSSTIGADITGVTFTGNNVVSGNAKGIEIVGDSDANAAAHNTPRWNITGTGGNQIDLGTAAFSSNGTDIINYQTKGLQALSATFSGLTGNAMNASQRSTQDGKFIDTLDYSNFGLVKYWTTVVTVNNLSTDDTTPALTGTVNDKDADVNVTVNGHTYVANVSSTANGSGTYDWNVGVADALAVGTYDVSVAATDPGGNVSNDATTNELTITAPTSSGGGSGGSGSSGSGGSSSGSGGSGGGTTTTTGGGRGAGFFANFGFGAGADAGQVLGATNDDTKDNSDDNNKGKVKSASVTKVSKTTDSDNAFLGLGWWWIPIVIALLALLYFLYRRFRPSEEA